MLEGLHFWAVGFQLLWQQAVPAHQLVLSTGTAHRRVQRRRLLCLILLEERPEDVSLLSAQHTEVCKDHTSVGLQRHSTRHTTVTQQIDAE